MADFARAIIHKTVKNPQQFEEALERNPIAAAMLEKVLAVNSETLGILTDFEAQVATTANLLQSDVVDPEEVKKKKGKKRRHRKTQDKKAIEAEGQLERLSAEDKEQLVATVLREHQILDLAVGNCVMNFPGKVKSGTPVLAGFGNHVDPRAS